jgi:fimbrial chaperone protein
VHKATFVARLLALGALLGACGAALAGSFEVNPIRVELSAANRSAALSVRNTGPAAVVVQLNAQTWSQQDGKDVLTDTRDVLLSPTVATIAPGAEQIVRVGLRRAPDAQRELSYRLFIQEVPPPPQPGFQGLVVALRVGLPVFVQPKQGPAKATLVWNAALAAPDTVRVTVENKGTGHVQVSSLALFAPQGAEALAAHSGLSYVLPGQGREWNLKLRQGGVAGGDRLLMKVATDAGSISTELDLAGK